MVKRAVILVRLVKESVERADEDIEKEIFEELCEGLPKIPWSERVEKVTVIERKTRVRFK